MFSDNVVYNQLSKQFYKSFRKISKSSQCLCYFHLPLASTIPCTSKNHCWQNQTKWRWRKSPAYCLSVDKSLIPCLWIWKQRRDKLLTPSECEKFSCFVDSVEAEKGWMKYSDSTLILKVVKNGFSVTSIYRESVDAKVFSSFIAAFRFIENFFVQRSFTSSAVLLFSMLFRIIYSFIAKPPRLRRTCFLQQKLFFSANWRQQFNFI